jgi:hypothetical protein
MDRNASGELNWRLSAHPITLLVFLGFRIGSSHAYNDFPSMESWANSAIPAC